MNTEQMVVEFKQSVTDALLGYGFLEEEAVDFERNIRVGPLRVTVEDIYKIAGEGKDVLVAGKLYSDLIIQQLEEYLFEKGVTLPEDYKSKSLFNVEMQVINSEEGSMELQIPLLIDWYTLGEDNGTN